MYEENFISQSDPTRPLDINEVSLEEQFTKLSDREQLMVICKMLGMNHVPVDIHTFIFDDYFLGLITSHGTSLFKFWLDKLDYIFPTPVFTKTPFISFSGAIGTGKSFVSKIIGLYYYHRLDCCVDAARSLGLASGTGLAYGFFHASEETARKEFYNYYRDDIFSVSPYFRNLYNKPKIRLIPSGPKATGSVIGTQLVFCILSEIGFWKPQDAQSKMSEVITRFKNRFLPKRFNFGGVIADSSAKDSDHGATELFESRIEPKELFKVAPSHWDVRPDSYTNSSGVIETFRFFIGDNTKLPRVIEDNEDPIKLGMDLDRIIKPPVALLNDFIADPVKNLQDMAGIPYTGTSLFFGGDLTHLKKCSCLVNNAPEEITVDFFDKSDTIYSYVAPMINKIPKKTNLFVHYDIGLQKDKTGVCLCYYTGEVSDPSGTTKYPTFRIPLLFIVSRKKGQSTSLDHLYQFLKDLIKEGYYVTFSADSFASAGIFQSCERDRIDYKAISIDKTMDAGVAFKNIVNTERIELPFHNTLMRECSEIRVVTNGKNQNHVKLDHPLYSSCTQFDYANKSGKNLPGTKDLFDAVCGAVFSCLQKYSEYLESGSNGDFEMSMKAINSVTASAKEESQRVFQDMLEEIF